jgi:hypothetical protein
MSRSAARRRPVMTDAARAPPRRPSTSALSAFGPTEVREALAALPEEQRVAVYLADVEGFAYREIAEIMGSPVGTVMSRLHRGRSALRASLADYATRNGMVDEPRPRGRVGGGPCMSTTTTGSHGGAACRRERGASALRRPRRTHRAVPRRRARREETRELDEHLDDCLPVHDGARAAGRIRELVREGCAERAPADLVDRVRARLDRGRCGPGRR